MKKGILLCLLSVVMLFSVTAFGIATAATDAKYYVTDGFTVTEEGDTLRASGSLESGSFAMVINQPLKVENGVSFDIKLKIDGEGTDMWNQSFARSVGISLNTGDPSQVALFGPALTAGGTGTGIQAGFGGMNQNDYYNGTSTFYAHSFLGVNGSVFTSGHAGINHPMIAHGAEVVKNLYEGTKGIRVTLTEDAEKYNLKFNALDESGNVQYESIYTSFTFVYYKEAGTYGNVAHPGFRYTSAPYLALTAYNDPSGISGDERNNDFTVELSRMQNGLWDVFEVPALSVKEGGTGKLVPQVTKPVDDNNPADLTYTYTSADPAIATVDEATGAVTGVKSGKTTVTVTSNQGYSVSVPVTVTSTMHEISIKSAAGKVLVRNNSVQDTFQLEAEAVENPDATFPFDDIVLSYASEDEDIATVDSATGLITAQGSGTTNIVVSTNEGAQAMYEIKVNDGEAPTIQAPAFGTGLEQFGKMVLPKPIVEDNYDGVVSISAKITSPEYIVFDDMSEDLEFVPEAYGTYRIIYTATDAGGLTSEFAASFDVRDKYEKSLDYYFGDTGEGLDSTRAINIENGVRVLGDIRHGRSRLIVDDAIKTEQELTFDFTVDLLSPDDSYFNNGTELNGNAIQVGIMLNESVRMANGSLDYSYFYPNYTGWTGAAANGIQLVFKQFEKDGPVFMETFANGSLPLAYATLREYGAAGAAVEAAMDDGLPVHFRCYENDEKKVYVVEMSAYTDSGLTDPLVLEFAYANLNPKNPEEGFSTQPYLAMIASGYNFDANYNEVPNGKYHHVDMAISNIYNTPVRGISVESTAIDINADYQLNVSGIAYPGQTLPNDLAYTYTSSDTELATVTADGLIQPTWKKFGQLTVTVKSNYGDVLEISVTINVKSFTIGTERLEMKAGETYQMTYTVDPATVIPTWSSSNNSIVRVDENGKITAVKEGQASIIMTVGAESIVCRVIVYPGDETDGGNEGGDQEIPEDPDSIDSALEQTGGCGNVLFGTAGAAAVLATGAAAAWILRKKK